MSLSRRHFLRGSSGIVLGLPFLEMLAPRCAQAQSAVPKRVLLIATGFSMDINRSYERSTFSASGDDTNIGELSPILQPFQPFADKVNLLGGIDNVVAQLMRSNGHNASGKTLLASHVGQNAIDSSGRLIPDSSCNLETQIAGPSIDHYLASQLGVPLLPLSLGGPNAEHQMRWQEVGGSVVFDGGQVNPLRVFQEMFAAQLGGGPRPEPTPLEKIRAQRGSVLDGVLDQLAAVRRRAGTADRERLERHADLVRAVEQDVDRVVTIVCSDPDLPVPANWSTIESKLRSAEGEYDDVLLDVMGRLSALAFSCQATQVSSIHLRNMQVNTFPWLNGGQPYIPGNFHALVHRDEGTAEQRETILRWYSSAIADIWASLNEIPDGPESTLADNTLVVWVSSLRHSSHTVADLPVLMMGDLQGTFRTGRYVDYQPGGGRTLGDLWTTVLQAMGVMDSAFGWNTGDGHDGRRLNNGPLEELFA